MKKRIVFFIALFAMSAFINAASVSESFSGSVSQEIITSTATTKASAQQGYPQCQANCYALYFYCQQSCYPYGGSYCLNQCANSFTVCMNSCQN